MNLGRIVVHLRRIVRLGRIAVRLGRIIASDVCTTLIAFFLHPHSFILDAKVDLSLFLSLFKKRESRNKNLLSVFLKRFSFLNFLRQRSLSKKSKMHLASLCVLLGLAALSLAAPLRKLIYNNS